MEVLTTIILTCAQISDLSARLKNSKDLTSQQKSEIIKVLKENSECYHEQ